MNVALIGVAVCPAEGLAVLRRFVAITVDHSSRVLHSAGLLSATRDPHEALSAPPAPES